MGGWNEGGEWYDDGNGERKGEGKGKPNPLPLQMKNF